jgi:hypothetical protein
MPDTNLEALMGWVQQLIVHPEGVEAALGAPEAKTHMTVTPETINRVILPSPTLSAIERLSVYANMYPARMCEALEADYPVIKHYLGQENWEALVSAYVHVHPSRHPNLNYLGQHFPAFVKKLNAGEVELPANVPRPEIRERVFVQEMAELEQAITEVFDIEDSPQVNVDDLVRLPPEAWASAVFEPIKALRVLAFTHPVNAYLHATKNDKEPPRIQRSQTYVAVYRKDYVVWRRELSRPQYRILKLLMEGKTVGEALVKGTKGGGTDLAGLAAQLQTWFRSWVEEGWFSRIRVVPDED